MAKMKQKEKLKAKSKSSLVRTKPNKKVAQFKQKHQVKSAFKTKPDASNADFSRMSVDEFMNSVEQEDVGSPEVRQNGTSTSRKQSGSENPLWNEDEDLDEGNSDKYEDEIQLHKASLANLKDIDPEFYKFLQDNDKKLLQFNVSDSEGEEQEEKEDKFHKPSGDLEVASDESDFEGEDKEEASGRQVVTLRLLKKWQSDLQTDKSNKTIGCVVKAFHAALVRVSNEEDDVAEYKVDGSSVFNAVIQLCVLELSPAVRRFLGMTSSKIQPHRCKKFVKVKVLLRSYFVDLLKLLGGVTSTNILTVLLKHLHHMSPVLSSFPKISKQMVKKLIHLWGTGDEVVRVVAFLCILRIANSQLQSLLEIVLKSMYMTYVLNSKFVSVNSLSGINFMRRSLTEIFALDPAVSYQHVFLYIRQLAIHLRNAITTRKKENTQTVYNWQFVNSLKLWGSLLAATYDKPQLQPLVYPFVQVCVGTIKLVPTAQYYPLRFHLVQLLVDFTKETGVFVPILPFILEVLQDYDFNKKNKKMSLKPLDLTCLLRASSSQMEENAFKDALIENVHNLLLEYLSSQSHSLAFPDLSLFCVIQIKQFFKKCTHQTYHRKLKQILEKIHQNNNFIENERKSVSFALTDYPKITAWETTVKNKGTPLGVFYESWNKMRLLKKKKDITNNDKLGDYNLPTIKKIKRDVKKDDKPANPFPSDSDSEGELKLKDEEASAPKHGKKRRKKRQKPQLSLQDGDDDQEDIVEDFNISDW